MSHESTNRVIHYSEDSVIANVATGSFSSATGILRDQNTKVMPKALNVWLENKISKKAALSKLIVRETAKHLYKYFVSDSGEVSNSKAFQASRGCFEIFKKFQAS